ncbi:oligosaccharide repeat unit polymerase [Aeromonas caviae]|uniref:oligosaccharide repeat unit polymerase n=1 Tax=Aeromonas TaxID=642 RepID=UPI0029D6E2B4|nr:oligosaccharide repeat unit polymerase [Aeromonas caviae]MDX7597079.1 oligosaccharide repeat unit polymerase [Aeromonas caviae]MDX7755630.1 oligosaccharide repeat unit polymerase [Aeromonas caviae]MDX7772744.1 oligosaccharide repeat unit polymerase [Aeromonas caviae]
MTHYSGQFKFYHNTRFIRYSFVILYVVSNIYACITMRDSGVYIGDYIGIPIEKSSPLFLLLFFTLLAYLFICGPLYSILVRLKSSYKGLTHEQKYSKAGNLILVIQLAYFIFNIVTGSNAAGGDPKAGGWIRFLWFIIPVDYIFYIYYVMARGGNRAKTYKLNVVIFIISQLSRGWLGWILIVTYIELCFMFANSRFKIRCWHLLFSLFLVLALPVLFYLKVALRELLSEQNMHNVFYVISHIDLALAYSYFIDGLFSRLQQLSNVVFIYEHAAQIKNSIAINEVANFYWEGLFQQTIAKMIGVYPGEDMHLFLYSNYISDSTTTLQTGFISWFFLDDLFGTMYVTYVLFLMITAVYLSKKLGGERLCSLTWFFVFLYLLCGWFNAFLVYIQSLITVFIFLRLSSKLRTSPGNLMSK